MAVKRKMKILFVFPTNRTELAKEIRAGVSPDNGFYGVNHIEGASFVDVSPVSQRLLDILFLPLYRLFQNQIDIGFQLGRALWYLSSMNQAEVVVTNTDSIGLPICLLKRLGLIKSPVIYSVGLFYIRGQLKNAIDSGENTLFRRFYTWILSAAVHIVYHSPIEKEKLIKLGLYNPTYCSFVPMGSDTNFFRKLTSSSTIPGLASARPRAGNHPRPRLGSAEGGQPSTILSVGRDHARDYETLFLAAEKLAELNFVVICSQRNIEGLEIPRNVKILVDLPYQKVAEWYQKSPVIVIPMKEMHRSSGQMTLTDAIQAEKPIIASDVVGISHFGLKNGQDALLVSPGNAKQLAEAINKLTLNGALRRKLGQGTRKLAQRFTTENYARNIDMVIRLVKEGIRLRPFEKKDLEFLRLTRNENRQYFLDDSYISKPVQHKWFEKYRRKTDDYMFILEDKGKSIGVGAIYNIDLVDKTAEIGRFVVDKQFHGRGYGTLMLNKILSVAKNELRLSKLKLEVYKDNKRAVRLYRAEGFKIQNVKKSGRRQTVLMIQSFHAANEPK